MAIVTPSATPIAGGYLVRWGPLASGDTGLPWPCPGHSDLNLDPPDVSTLTDRSVQIFGGTVGGIHLEGSNAIATTISAWATLHEVDGTTALTFTAAGIRQVLEATYYTRPAATNGASATNVLMKLTAGVNRF